MGCVMIFSSAAIGLLRLGYALRLGPERNTRPGTLLRRACRPASDVEVSDFLGVLLDELTPRLHLIAHERLEQLVHDIHAAVAVRTVRRELDLQQRPGLWVHRRLPELL